MSPSAALSDPVDSSARSLLYEMLSHLKRRDFAVELWNGEVWPAKSKIPLFKLIFRSPEVVRAMFSHPSALSFGEAYIYGYLDIEGSLLDVFQSGEQLLNIELPWAEKLHMARQLWSIPAPDYRRGGVFGGFRGRFASAGARLRAAVNYHYDHPVDFWRLWLDESLCYSCAYFELPDLSLNEAQKRKVDYICRKLRLQPGQRLLDLGCGWGALIVHAAAHYGVDALGVTLSPQQAEVARERIRAAGLSARCRVEVADFLELNPGETFDRISSIGAAEHVPAKFFAGYFARAFEWLRPGGQFLHHAIVHAPSIAERPGRSFMQRYIFPEHCLASIGRTIAASESAGFEVRDVESLREHYNRTLQHWLRRLEAAQSAVERQSDPLSFRIFRLYLAGSAYEFAIGRLNIYQSLLIKPKQGQSGLPLTRADWYSRAVPAREDDRAAARNEALGGFDQDEAEQHYDRAERGVHL